MAILSITQSYTIVIDGQTYTGGSKTAATVTLAGETIFDRIYSIAGSATAQTEIFRAGPSTTVETNDIVDWGFLFIQSDVDGHIRIVMNETTGTPAGNQHGLVIALRAGIPFMWPGGDGSKGESAGNIDSDLEAAGWAAEAAGVLNAIEYNSTATAQVRVVAIR